MHFRIADTFTDSLAKLSGDEQKAVKITTFDLQANPANPGLSFHKLDRAKDKRFWSVRVNRDIRIIVHKTEASLLLCYVDHHEDAYQWAERRKIEIHPKTGAAQIVEIREMVKEIIVPKYIQEDEAVAPRPYEPKPLLFAHIVNEELLGYGVPQEWLNDVRAADEDSLLELAEHLPGEAAEALLELAVGGKPQPRPVTLQEALPRDVADYRLPPPVFEHPDAQRRFRVMDDREALERALDYPWEKWTIFLHPSQRDLVEKDYNGPARVSGSAGTGKTVVALHRAVYLARQHPKARVLLTTFSDTLANALKTKLRRLISNQPRLAERLEIHAVNAVGKRLFEAQYGEVKIALADEIGHFLVQAADKIREKRFTRRFLKTEWAEVVDAWQLESWEAYCNVLRLGRKIRLPEARRKVLWAIFEQVRERLSARGLITWPELFKRVTEQIANRRHPPFDFAVVDESQDINVSQLRFLAALGGNRPNSLFFAGDLGQRIFQTPFSWKTLGVDIRGRSRTLRVNYRTSHQIRQQADRLLGPEVTDVDGNVEDRRHTISVFNGPPPDIRVMEDASAEIITVSQWMAERFNDGLLPHEIGLFVRSTGEMDRVVSAVKKTGRKYILLDDTVETTHGAVSIATMHLAKGLEFRAVVVMACDDEIIPLQSRIETSADDSDLEETYNTERHLLYVACTRARDFLLVTGVEPASEFLDDFTAV
ncbi:MAG: UvrD-helicase domain-containing protein [Thermodesulfobacteriota bacterium]|nr:UvrD-helicase domain-containing protein [Thermodesulfobacteriota bacterium]